MLLRYIGSRCSLVSNVQGKRLQNASFLGWFFVFVCFLFYWVEIVDKGDMYFIVGIL